MDRSAILAAVPGLSDLPALALQALADRMREETHAPGATVVVEGDIGDCFYVITRGTAEVSAHQIPLARLGPQDVFGEIALLSPTARRTATVRAQTELGVLTLSAVDFHQLLERNPVLKHYLQASARRLLRLRFLKLSTPFSDGSESALLRLAEEAEDVRVAAGDTVIRAGEAGDTAYCLVSGRLQVLREDRAVAELEVGALFGEAALLTGEPRNATVQALEPSELIVLRRATVLAAMGDDPRVASACLTMLRLRERPRRMPDIEVFDSQSADGTPFTMLKDGGTGRCFHLSVEGRFLWDRLDGERDLRALAIEFSVAFKRFAPDMVAAIINALATAGFVQVRSLAPDVRAVTGDVGGPWRHIAGVVRDALNWHMVLNHCDPWISRLHAAGIRWFYTWPLLGAMALIALAGMVAFVLHAAPAWRALSASGPLLAMWWLLPAGLFALLAHEAGHAFTVKACGRKVERIGVGWYWVTPVLFVDTSDMWLAGKWQRVAVGVAGLCVNLVLAGFAAVLAVLWGGEAGAVAWLFAALSYALVFFNLNPLLEYDGYHVLSDLLERPNLRRATADPLDPGVDLLYGAIVATYIAVLGVLFLAMRSAM